jgi:hypothetical protein
MPEACRPRRAYTLSRLSVQSWLRRRYMRPIIAKRVTVEDMAVRIELVVRPCAYKTSGVIK